MRLPVVINYKPLDFDPDTLYLNKAINEPGTKFDSESNKRR